MESKSDMSKEEVGKKKARQRKESSMRSRIHTREERKERERSVIRLR